MKPNHCINPSRGGLWKRAALGARSILALAVFVVAAAACSVKPEPYTEGQFVSLAQADQRAIAQFSPPLTDGRLSLEEAILRALAFNLDHRLALSENISAERERVLSAISMLPDITGTGNFYYRENENASSSMSWRTRRQSLEPSFSSPKGRQWGALEFSWSIVDCGVSYFQAKQQADRVLITLERRRRTINTIVKDVISTYYRARAAQKYLGRLTVLIGEAEGALRAYRRIEREQAEPLPSVLENQRRLLNLIAQLKRLESDLKQSRSHLAALCGLPLREKFHLPTKPLALPPMAHDIEEMELLGLYLRPELREEHYQERIDVASIKQEMLKMFPAVRLLATLNFDANPYLVYDHWTEAGLQVSTSLLKLAATGPKSMAAAEAKRELSQMRRLALSMATVVQINLSRHQYHLALEDLAASRQMRNLERRLLKQVKAEAALEAEGRLALIQQNAQTITSELAFDLARVDAYTALGNLYFSVGAGLADGLAPEAAPEEIIQTVRAGLLDFSRGHLPAPSSAEEVEGAQPPDLAPNAAALEALSQAAAQ